MPVSFVIKGVIVLANKYFAYDFRLKRFRFYLFLRICSKNDRFSAGRTCYLFLYFKIMYIILNNILTQDIEFDTSNKYSLNIKCERLYHEYIQLLKC